MTKYLKGLDKVVGELNKSIQKLDKVLMPGLISAGILILRDTDKTPPVVPVDTGNLRASWFIVTSKGSKPYGAQPPQYKGPQAEELTKNHPQVVQTAISRAKKTRGPNIVFGYTAYYATVVHERIGARFQRKNAGAKWFEAAIKRNRNKIIQTIAVETHKNWLKGRRRT